jgi:hypothetical protein
VRVRLLLLLPAIAWMCLHAHTAAQEAPFSGIVRGVLIECGQTISAGEFSVRTAASNQVYRYTFDARTYVEREDRRISMAAVRKGDTVEIVSDREESVAVHYARTVHVIEARPAPRPISQAGRSRPYRSPVDLLAPRGNLTYSGVIARLAADHLVLHTRQEGEKTILLRLDTSYLESGTLVDAADLKPNTRVFVRAGKSLDDRIEAYQVVWGDILEPSRRDR